MSWTTVPDTSVSYSDVSQSQNYVDADYVLAGYVFDERWVEVAETQVTWT